MGLRKRSRAIQRVAIYSERRSLCRSTQIFSHAPFDSPPVIHHVTRFPMVRLINRAATASLVLIVISAFSGCILDPRFLKMPNFNPRHPDIEHRAAEYHDPWPDDAIGPSTGTRPLGFTRQRSWTRRAAELRGIHQLDPYDRLPSTSVEPDRDRYSQVVKP